VQDEFLTVNEIAARFKVNQQTVRNWIDQGALTAVRVGPRRVRVRQSDLDAYIEASSTATAGDVEQARGEFDRALEAVQQDNGGDDAAALRRLAQAAHRLARSLPRA
jgi:excisionase family DNA binding protein